METSTVVYSFGSNEFEWHDVKAKSNLEKHGVRFEEAATAFEDDSALVFADTKHSDKESRLILIGSTTESRTVTIIHIKRVGRLRLISARAANLKERAVYDGERRVGVRDAGRL